MKFRTTLDLEIEADSQEEAEQYVNYSLSAIESGSWNRGVLVYPNPVEKVPEKRYLIAVERGEEYFKRSTGDGWNTWTNQRGDAMLFETREDAEAKKEVLVKGGAEEWFLSPIVVKEVDNG